MTNLRSNIEIWIRLQKIVIQTLKFLQRALKISRIGELRDGRTASSAILAQGFRTASCGIAGGSVFGFLVEVKSGGEAKRIPVR